MNCEHIKEQLLSYINNELDASERENIESHFFVCPTCKGEMEALAATESKLRQVYGTVAAGVSPSPGVLSEIRQEVARRERSRSTLRGWIGLQLRQTFARFNWRRPVRQTAFAGSVAMICLAVIMFNRGPGSEQLSNSDSLSFAWTANEQAAIDIALNDPSVQAMLDGEGVVYEVIPVNGNGTTEKYKVAFFDVDEDVADDISERGWDSYSAPSTYSDGVAVPLSGELAFDASNNAIVDIEANSVLQSHSNKNAGASVWLSTEQIEEAADIAVSYGSLGSEAVTNGALSIDSEAEVLVRNVTQFNVYDSYSNSFSDEMEVWVRLTIDETSYFAQVDLEEDNVVKLIEGGE
ncbi:MAG: hypothetical protein HN929_06675 [Chloroflexi bacterium]|jgi:hypothetical protein|nr:hypothetical protein [Chloroflexota bacterium]MBT7081130.1 hypothetical protein [Chloroflexota bacterium]